MDTATRHVIVALGSTTTPLASVVREVAPGRGIPLLTLIEEALRAAGATMTDVGAIGVGTGPGRFTGLRVGLATAKTLCWLRRLPLVAMPSDEVIRRSAALADPALREPPVVVLPAGARDHYVALPDSDPVLLPPSANLAAELGGRPAVALDMAPGEVAEGLVRDMTGLGHPDPVALGSAALGHTPEALLSIMDERLATGTTADPATLVPRYVALPRGIPASPVDVGTTLTDTTRRDEAWSPTHR